MNKLHLKALLPCVLTLALVGCGGGGSGSEGVAAGPQESEGSASATYLIDLPYQQPQLIAKEKVYLNLVSVQDDRCSLGVQCVSEGWAKVSVDVTLPGYVSERVSLSVQNASKIPDNATVRDYQITLLRLSPAQVRPGESPTVYVAAVRLEKLAVPKAP